MERVILYVDDAQHALAQLEQLRASGVQPTHWVLAACAPRMTSRISKWVSHSARENWRVKWFARLQETLAPALNRAISTPSNDFGPSSSTVTSPLPMRSVWPALRLLARGTSFETGNFRWSRVRSISRPTAPVAPATATTKDDLDDMRRSIPGRRAEV